jgi:hypothetical protein
MHNRDKAINKPTSGKAGKKLNYRPPELIRFGSVRDLTAEGSGPHPENSGADEGNNKRRFS